MTQRTVFVSLAMGLCAAVVTVGYAQQQGVDQRPANGATQKPAFAGQTDAPERKTNVAFDVVTAAEGLEFPWGMTFLPGGRMLVTEKAGRLRIVSPEGTLSAPVTGLPAFDTRGQGGLLDVEIDPAFATNQMVYFSFSEPHDGEVRTNNTAVGRGKLVEGDAPRLDNVEIIYKQAPSLPRTSGHYGSRLVFGRDGTLFVTQGDRQVEAGRDLVQKLDTLQGKIVRINKDGSIPKDNPFVGKPEVRGEIWSLGHRNAQAATLNPATGELWEVEHGTKGGDELNIVRKGKNYGWPIIAYGIEYQGGPIRGGITAQEGLEQPIYYWDPVIAPSGMTFYTGDLFPAWKGSLLIGGLETRNLVRLDIKGERVVGEERLLKDQTERIRDVVQGPEGAIYVLTDNKAGRVLKLVPKK
jgi:aldose sugar dehydrogenase